jgi:hypothetical protein
VIQVPAAEATASAVAPKVRSTSDATTMFDVRREVWWTRTPECWLVRVSNQNGDILDLAIGEDAREVLALLDAALLPPGE